MDYRIIEPPLFIYTKPYGSEQTGYADIFYFDGFQDFNGLVDGYFQYTGSPARYTRSLKSILKDNPIKIKQDNLSKKVIEAYEKNMR